MHNADDWDELLLPEIERQQKHREEVVVRADVAFAKPDIYEALEERDVSARCELRHSHPCQRELGTGHC